MPLTIDLPSPLDHEISREAEREGISAAEHAALLLIVATALRGEDQPTPFQGAVKEFLESRSLDMSRVASALDDLVMACLYHDLGNDARAPQETVAGGEDLSAMQSHATQVLRRWRNGIVHTAVQRTGKMRRSSALGKYAHIPGSSEEFAQEKGQEIAREEKGKT